MSEGFLPTQDSRAGQRQPGTARVPSSQRRLRPHGSSVRAGPQPHGRAPSPVQLRVGVSVCTRQSLRTYSEHRLCPVPCWAQGTRRVCESRVDGETRPRTNGNWASP